jgi:hypothetical protein
MIRFNCSECDRPFKVADEHAGKSIRCPGCKGVIKVPAEDAEEEPAPPPAKKSRAVQSSAQTPPKRKPRLEQEEEEEEETPRRRSKARLEPEEEEDEAPRRRRRDEEDEEDEDDRPRKKKKKKKKQDDPDSTVFIILSLGLTAVFLVLGVVGWFHHMGAILMIVVGAVAMAIGTWWIQHIASEESDMAWFAVTYVPFYDTWFALTRWSRTWGAVLICWIGRFFVITGIILLIIHFVSGRVGGGGGWPRPGPVQTPAEIDAECARLLKSRDATEARAWLAAGNRRIQNVTVGPLNLRAAVEGLYQQGAVKVTFAEIMSDEEEDIPDNVIVELPAEKEKRQALINYVNKQLVDDDDDKQTDKGQKYLLLHAF